MLPAEISVKGIPFYFLSKFSICGLCWGMTLLSAPDLVYRCCYSKMTSCNSTFFLMDCFFMQYWLPRPVEPSASCEATYLLLEWHWFNYVFKQIQVWALLITLQELLGHGEKLMLNFYRNPHSFSLYCRFIFQILISDTFTIQWADLVKKKFSNTSCLKMAGESLIV